jgi:hypothetical protein
MNISFHNKVAFGLIALACVLVWMWRYEFRIEDPRHKALISSVQNDLHERDRLSGALVELKVTQGAIERIAVQGEVDNSADESLSRSLGSLQAIGDKIFTAEENPFKQLNADVTEFSKIAAQLALYEGKVDEFISGFRVYFQTLEQSAQQWKDAAEVTIATGGTVAGTISFSELDLKLSVLEKAIPEFNNLKQRVKVLESGYDQWVRDINAADNVAEKQAAFTQKQFLLKGIPELSGTFNEYIEKSVERERANVELIAQQIVASLGDIQRQVEEKFAVKNNSIQTVMAQTKYRDDQYRKIKYGVTAFIFAGIIVFFFGMTIYSFRFEKGLAIFKRKTFEAAQTSREISSALKDNSALAAGNFDLANTLKEGLADVAGGFLARQNNLQHIDHLVRDTDALIKESHENFTHIKDEFYNSEKISQEVVHLTGALEGVALQMTTIAEAIASNPQPVEGKEKTIDELKYLAGRIRYSVNATHTTLNSRAAKIEEAKAKFTLIENNMTQMTENTKQALRSLALARLDHSEEVNRINEILENAKTTSRVIVKEIETLNKQINDFSLLSKHLAALHDLAVKASALNAQSMLPEAAEVNATVATSQRMNSYVQEYFKKIFENTALQADEIKPVAEKILQSAKTPRIHTPADV